MAQLIIVRGLPGSGKSTLAHQIAYEINRGVPDFSYAQVFEADQFFMIDGKYQFEVSELPQAHGDCLARTAKQLDAGGIAIVSNTFTTRRELKPYFNLAKKFGIVPVVYLAQNNFGSVHNVPEETMAKMRERFCFDISELFGEQDA
jgi:predicted kinase